jgi:hypothetical protein
MHFFMNRTLLPLQVLLSVPKRRKWRRLVQRDFGRTHCAGVLLSPPNSFESDWHLGPATDVYDRMTIFEDHLVRDINAGNPSCIWPAEALRHAEDV